MALHDTTAKDEVADHLRRARARIATLQKWLKGMDEEMEKAIEKHDGDAFSGLSCATMMEEATGILYEIGMANGACLVRSTK